MYEYEIRVMRRKLSDKENVKYDEGVTAEASYIVKHDSGDMVPVIMNMIDLTTSFDGVEVNIDKMEI